MRVLSSLQRLGRAVKQVQYRHHLAADRALGEVGTTLAQWDALRAIALEPGASAHALAVATFQSDQAFGTLAGRLLAQGLIERQPGAGRRIEHRLTPAGEGVLAAGSRVVEVVLERSFGALSGAERALLTDLLGRVGHPVEKGAEGAAARP